MMAKYHNIIAQSLDVLSFTYLLFMATLSVTTPTKIILPLIHRNSILSPFYNPKLLISNPANHAINSTGQFSLPPDDIRGNLMPDANSFVFFVNVSIGQPPVSQLLVMDTGSQLTWVCTKCAPGLSPVYDPKRSSTYKKIGCTYFPQCLNYYDTTDCEQESQCSYRIKYADGSNSTGFLAMEKFTFDTSTEGLVELSNLTFGCGLNNLGNVGIISGILGLGPFNQHSLMARVGNQFSYCIGNISDHYYAYNQLILGYGAIFEGSSTPMVIKGKKYFIHLEGISVGEKQLKIDLKESNFNVMLDSGTTFTLLQKNLFDPLKREIMNLMDGLLQPVQVVNGGESLCYFGNLVRDLKGFPIVSFHFAQGADLDLSVEAMFRRESDDVFCTNVDVFKEDHSIIGAYAQQYYNIGFDLHDMEVTFQRIDCELLEG